MTSPANGPGPGLDASPSAAFRAQLLEMIGALESSGRRKCAETLAASVEAWWPEQLERRGDPDPARVIRSADVEADLSVPGERRRASRFLWAACEALLAAAAEPRSLNRALDMLMRAFECDGVALHAMGPSGQLEPWSARGAWRTTPGDLRDCMSVPLFRGTERVGTLDLLARPGTSWRPAQLGLIRTGAGALGAALGARLELQRLRNAPGRDALTGLPDAGAFHARLGEELARGCRRGTPVSAVMLDLDRLAAVNERYGRPAGDVVLSETALVLKLALCPADGVETVELMDAAARALALAKKAGRRRVMIVSPAAVH